MIKLLLLLFISFSLYGEENCDEYYSGNVGDKILIKIFVINEHEPVIEDTENYSIEVHFRFLKTLDDDSVIYEYDFTLIPKKVGDFKFPVTIYKEKPTTANPMPEVVKTLKYDVNVLEQPKDHKDDPLLLNLDN